MAPRFLVWSFKILCSSWDSNLEPPTQSKALARARLPTRPHGSTYHITVLKLFEFAYVDSWGASKLGLSPNPQSYIQ
jgi:hypothetical protein